MRHGEIESAERSSSCFRQDERLLGNLVTLATVFIRPHSRASDFTPAIRILEFNTGARF